MAIRFYEHEQTATPKLVYPREYEYQAHYRGYCFGIFRVFRGDQSIGEMMHRRTKARSLLKWFLLNPGKLGSADEFLDLFWSEVPPEKARSNFHVTIHYLRHKLESSLHPRQRSSFIHRTAHNFYSFQMDEQWWTDTRDIALLFERARTYDQYGDDERALYYYRQVAAYCNQGFLPEDASEEWLAPYRHHYTLLHSQALVRLIQLYTHKAQMEEVLEYGYQLLQLDPYNELAVRTIVDVSLHQGNISIAQRRLDTFEKAIQKDLGLGPSREFCVLRERIRLALH